MHKKLFSDQELSKIANPKDSSDMAGKLSEVMGDRGFYEGEFRLHRPWGLELKIREDLISVFVNSFFEDGYLPPIIIEKPTGPRILAITNGKELPCQDNDNQHAFLRVLSGGLQVQKVVGEENEEITMADVGELIQIPQNVRKSLVGVAKWSLVAQILARPDYFAGGGEKD